MDCPFCCFRRIRTGFNAAKGQGILEILLNEKTEIATLSKQHFIDSIDIISREKVSVNRLNDKLIVSVAKAKKSPIFTYDKEIKKQWKKTI